MKTIFSLFLFLISQSAFSQSYDQYIFEIENDCSTQSGYKLTTFNSFEDLSFKFERVQDELGIRNLLKVENFIYSTCINNSKNRYKMYLYLFDNKNELKHYFKFGLTNKKENGKYIFEYQQFEIDGAVYEYTVNIKTNDDNTSIEFINKDKLTILNLNHTPKVLSNEEEEITNFYESLEYDVDSFNEILTNKKTLFILSGDKNKNLFRKNDYLSIIDLPLSDDPNILLIIYNAFKTSENNYYGLIVSFILDDFNIRSFSYEIDASQYYRIDFSKHSSNFYKFGKIKLDKNPDIHLELGNFIQQTNYSILKDIYEKTRFYSNNDAKLSSICDEFGIEEQYMLAIKDSVKPFLNLINTDKSVTQKNLIKFIINNNLEDELSGFKNLIKTISKF